MVKQVMRITGIGFSLLVISSVTQAIQPEKMSDPAGKVVYVNSYHTGYDWSDGIAASIRKTFEKTGVELIVFEMDTKRHQDEAFIRHAALNAKALIEKHQPDVVIASDDNASKYLIAPYFKNVDLPVVFCGVNWDASEYGFPCRNVTGMIEVQMIDQILDTLRGYANGNRIGFIKGEDQSARKEAYFYEARFHIRLDKRFVRNFTEWKAAYAALQKDTDMILVGNAAAIPDWDPAAAIVFVETTTEVPTGNWDEWMKAFTLVTYATIPSEQGRWAAQTALDILSGKSPADIPVVTNKKAKIFRNMRLAKKLNIIFPMSFIRRSQSVTMPVRP